MAGGRGARMMADVEMIVVCIWRMFTQHHFSVITYHHSPHARYMAQKRVAVNSAPNACPTIMLQLQPNSRLSMMSNTPSNPSQPCLAPIRERSRRRHTCQPFNPVDVHSPARLVYF